MLELFLALVGFFLLLWFMEEVGVKIFDFICDIAWRRERRRQVEANVKRQQELETILAEAERLSKKRWKVGDIVRWRGGPGIVNAIGSGEMEGCVRVGVFDDGSEKSQMTVMLSELMGNRGEWIPGKYLEPFRHENGDVG